MQKSDSSAPGAPSAPSAPSAPATTSGLPPGKQRVKVTGILRGKARPGTVEYELMRLSSGGVHPYPWRKLQHDAERKVELTSRGNDWEYEIIRYAAGLDRQSISRFVLKHALTAALKRIVQQEKDEPTEETG